MRTVPNTSQRPITDVYASVVSASTFISFSFGSTLLLFFRTLIPSLSVDAVLLSTFPRSLPALYFHVDGGTQPKLFRGGRSAAACRVMHDRRSSVLYVAAAWRHPSVRCRVVAVLLDFDVGDVGTSSTTLVYGTLQTSSGLHWTSTDFSLKILARPSCRGVW